MAREQAQNVLPSGFLLLLALQAASVSAYVTTTAPGMMLRGARARTRQGLALSALRMGNGYEGEMAVKIQRNFGDKFFLKGRYTNDARPTPREWTFQRTWEDFAELEKGIRTDKKLASNGGAKVSPLPPEPFLIGEDASFEPFQKYLDQVMAIPDALQSPFVYEFVNAPNSVLTSQALPGLVAIDVTASGEVRYDGKTSKYSIPVLDPIMLAEKAGKQYSSINKALSEAEIAKNAGKVAADVRKEGQKAGAAVAQEASKVVAEVGKTVNGKSTGKALGGMIGNLRAGKGLFGEKN
eukprot:CAMPEP_0206224564 /NCGR_PEP_ID=MMETSP0047_2-20121206/7093_1 /ASSEMBLY_ACC=CAM_ASM_000192 /TAXON_ID=195065 /ORGANISM="Chroomonas mesostigmatica_cf, Strain CCMP1168" /LENGTH=294 /DNA_ID=CAMNT_0053647529 /DNA_START=56 /DNA_END=937 /DNA_ORIENTATION=-